MGLFLRRKITTYLNTINAITQYNIKQGHIEHARAHAHDETRTRTHARQVSIKLDNKKLLTRVYTRVYNYVYKERRAKPMRKTNFTNRFKTVTTRAFEKNYYVDIQIDSKNKDDLIVDFYLWNINYGVKDHMFGLHMNDIANLYANFRMQCKTQRKLEGDYKELKELTEQNRSPIQYAINMIVEPQIKDYIKIYKEEFEDEK